ncbi:MAG: DUF4350 domain-containing protein [Candidatus Obscuribacter sp.]|jgi:hypothetical protein|nr:DUF4350 domain-containing protein [Candidatus Obscuribacter sp.]
MKQPDKEGNTATIEPPSANAPKPVSVKSTLSELPKGLLWQLGLLLLASGIITYTTMDSNQQMNKLLPETGVFTSSHNVKPSGLSGFYELCEKIFGHQKKVLRWEQPYRKLSGSPEMPKLMDKTRVIEKALPVHGTLILVRPDESLKDYAVESILDWVEAGNSLIYLDDFTFSFSRNLTKKLGINVTRLAPVLEDKLTDALDPMAFKNDKELAALYTHLRQIKVSAALSLTGGQPIAKVAGKTILTQKSWGKGTILIGSAPGMVSNKLIANTTCWSNFQLICNFLQKQDGDIIFEENCHGFTQGTSVWAYLFRGPTGYVLLQLLILMILAVAGSNKRFGAVKTVNKPRKIANTEYINGLANTYERARARKAALEIIYQNLHNKLSKAFGVSPHDPKERLLEEIRLHDNKIGNLQFDSHLVKDLEKCEQYLSGRELNDDNFKEAVAACDKISNQMTR